MERNPGPVWTCDICTNRITNNQTSLLCNTDIPHWVHKKCTNITTQQYRLTRGTWKCILHTNTTPTPTSTFSITPHTLTPPTPTNTCSTPPVTTGLPAPPTPTITRSPSPATARPHQTDNQNKHLNILQININGIHKKLTELQDLINTKQADIITVQETKLQTHHKTPVIPNYTPYRTDRPHKQGGGLVTYIHKTITFSPIPAPQHLNTRKTELQTIKIHLTQHKHLHITNIYIPPRQTTDPDHLTEDTDITNTFNYLDTLTNHIISGDINAHSTTWHSNTDDHRGTLIADLLQQSTHIILNTDTPTRLPHIDQSPTSPDITTASNNIANNTTWNTLHALSSDHLPILITYNTKTKFRLHQSLNTYTNYNKANWQAFTQEIENALENTTPPQNIHVANNVLTNIILNADKHHIPKGKIHNKHKLLPQNIRDLIARRDTIRQHNPKDPTLPVINNNIDKLIQEHKSNLWKQHLEDNWDHKTNTHILWKTIAGLTNKKPTNTSNTTIAINNKTAITDKQKASYFNKQFTNVIKHATHHSNRQTDRQTRTLPTTPIIITIEQTKAAIKQSRNNNSTGPDNINIKHLKHLGPRALTYLTHIYNTALNTNNIPNIWKQAKVIPIPKPNKNTSIGTSYRPIALLSPIAKTLEKIIIPYITDNITLPDHMHGFRQHRSTTTALHHINHVITTGFNQKQPPQRTIAIALDMSKAFDTVNLHTLIRKILNTNIPNTIIKYIANYIKGRTQYTLFNNTKSRQRYIKAGVPQGGVLSPTLFNIYMADLPTPPLPQIQTITYADDITILSTHTNTDTAQTQVTQYLQQIHDWTQQNQLTLNTSKTTTTLFTPDPAQYNTTLSLHINNNILPTVKNPKILGLTLDPKLTYSAHIQNTLKRATQTINMIKALTTTHWGKTKETLTTTYKAITRPIIEYANTIWSPITSTTNMQKLQTVQNKALRTITGCTLDTNTSHLHTETQILPITTHLQLHASQLRQQAQHPQHTLHAFTRKAPNPRYKKQTIFDNNNNYTYNIATNPENTTEATIKNNLKQIHTHIVNRHIDNTPHNRVLNMPAPPIDATEQTLSHSTRRTLAQLRTNKSPLLHAYLNKITPTTHPTPHCPLCGHHSHDTMHIFSCPRVATNLTPVDLWLRPVEAGALVARWRAELGVPPGTV